MFPLGIKNKGEVVGVGDSADGRDQKPFLWRDGERIALNDLVEPPIDLEFARAITEDDLIYATSYLEGLGYFLAVSLRAAASPA